MTKFLTRAHCLLPIALSALLSLFSEGSFAEAPLCSDVFTQSSLFDAGGQTSLQPDQQFTKNYVRFFQSPKLDPRVQKALVELNKGWRLELRRSDDDIGGLTPWIVGATIDLPRSALKSDVSLAEFLEQLIPLAREAKRFARIEQNRQAVEKLDPATKTLITKWFTQNDVRVFVKDSYDLGAAEKDRLTIDKKMLRYPSLIGTVIHEIYHVTVSARLRETSSALEIGRAMWFAPSSSQLSKAYARLHRSDEYDARLKQIAILRFHKLVNDARVIEPEAALFRQEQRDQLSMFTENFETVTITRSQDPAQLDRPALKLTFNENALYVPLVREVANPRAYAYEVLAKRLATL